MIQSYYWGTRSKTKINDHAIAQTSRLPNLECNVTDMINFCLAGVRDFLLRMHFETIIVENNQYTMPRFRAP